MTIFSLFEQGGWVMYVLLVFSIVTLAVIIERAVYYILSRDDLDALVERATAAWNGTGDRGLHETCDPAFVAQELRAEDVGGDAEPLSLTTNRGYAITLAAAYFSLLSGSRTDFEDALYTAGSGITKQNERGLQLLATMASISTLAGLFGTVLGMIQVFQKLAAIGGRADVALLSSGIWVALLTTAFGLVIAIPATLAQHGFSRIAEDRAENLDLLVTRLDLLTGRKTAKSGSGDAPE
jgi:biopolymer transport protein ExbB